MLMCFAALVLGVLMYPAGARPFRTQLVTRTTFRPAFSCLLDSIHTGSQLIPGDEPLKLFRRVYT